MASIDPFGRTDQLDDGMLGALEARFEARGKHPLFSKMLLEYLEAMNIAASAAVLDMGCGTGLAARAIARRSGFSGSVTGVDLSPYLVAAAKRLAGDEGVAARVDFRTGDARRLDFPDATFDALVAHTLLSHVDEPLSVLFEAARLVKPGGTIGIFDGDYASLAFGHADSLSGKSNDETLISALVANPWVMRQLPRLLQTAGLELVTTFSHVLAEIGAADFWSSAIEAYRKLVARAGAMTREQADAWATDLRNDSDAGVFFGSCNYFTFIARRP
jgi:ubiquinone/menaquinone biosynthesis C-methylase UbiE